MDILTLSSLSEEYMFILCLCLNLVFYYDQKSCAVKEVWSVCGGQDCSIEDLEFTVTDYNYFSVNTVYLNLNLSYKFFSDSYANLLNFD